MNEMRLKETLIGTLDSSAECQNGHNRIKFIDLSSDNSSKEKAYLKRMTCIDWWKP